MADEICVDVVQESNQVSADQKRNWIEEFDEKFMKRTSNKKHPEKEKQPVEEVQSEKKEKTAIYRIPANMREEFDDFYAPYRVSFGPYYHGKESCRSTEGIKELVVIHSLERSNKRIQDYEKALREVLKDLKDKYDELDQKWDQDDNAFLKLMIYDGCFFLEILRAGNHNDWSSPVRDTDLLNPNKLMEDYRHDMLLLENQLPLLVLEKLFDVQTNKPKHFMILDKIQKVDAQEYLNGHILEFFFPGINLKIPTKKCLHVLDLCRHNLLSQELRAESKVQCLSRIVDSSLWDSQCSLILIVILLSLLAPILWAILALVDMIRLLFKLIYFLFKLLTYIVKTQSATEFDFNFPSALALDEVGIGFTSKTRSLRDISYGRRTLTLPQIFVDGAVNSIFLNIIAFEQLHKDAKKEVTSYIYFMSSLIKGVDDVRHLQRCGVIVTRQRTADQIVELFNSLTKDINVHDPESFVVPRYRDVSESLTNGYYKMNKPWRKDLWQTYLRSPWAFVSILVAFFLFALNTVQTVYTVLGYYNSK